MTYRITHQNLYMGHMTLTGYHAIFEPVCRPLAMTKV